MKTVTLITLSLMIGIVLAITAAWSQDDMTIVDNASFDNPQRTTVDLRPRCAQRGRRHRRLRMCAITSTRTASCWKTSPRRIRAVRNATT